MYDSFLDTYTSKDNQNFQEIIEAADRKLRKKYSILFDAEEKIQNYFTLPSICDQYNNQHKNLNVLKSK